MERIEERVGTRREERRRNEQTSEPPGNGDARNPTYRPELTLGYYPGPVAWVHADVDSRPVNTNPPDGSGGFPQWTVTGKTWVRDTINDPFGRARKVISFEQNANANFFGADVTFGLGNLLLGEGSPIWIRWYEYFPPNFCFACGGGGDGSAGALKWMRFQDQRSAGGGGRLTYLIDAVASCAAPCGNCDGPYEPLNITEENMGWTPRYGSIFVPIKGTPNATTRPKGQWVATQIYMMLSEGDSDTGDGTGKIRAWVDNHFLGEWNRSTLAGGSALRQIFWGNYWNGGQPQDQDWQFSELIVSYEQPNTVDVGGRPYIHPDTRISDFS